MTALDWAVVVVLNGGIVAYSLIAFRNKGESFDWYLAAKSMPWWVIGLSAFGTAVDSGDYVGIVGGSYNLGLSQLAQWWLGIAVGWTVLSFFVIVPMYRSGVFTNAEWLEFRFGPSVRLLAVLINVQSRTNVLGNIFFSMFLVLNIIAGIEGTTCWLVVVGVALSSVLYIVRGGLRAGVLTDALQSATMIVASFVLWGFVYSGLGGWDGVTARLEAVEEGLADTLLHVGGYSPPGVPPFIVIFGFLVVLTTYAIINQYEAIRFLGARSEWDFKMAALVASIATAICLFFNVSLGPMARAQFPGLEIVDQAYPLMIEAYLPAGLVGLVVAGLVAAGYSTFDSIGIGISSLFVRDVYARFIVKNGTDAHYTKVGRISVPIILALGFVYVPFLGEKGMLLFYLRLAGAIAVPLMTVMLMGVFTRVHRQTGIVGLLVGLGYGMSAILADFNDWALPVWYQNTWWTYLWNLVLPALSMLIASKVIDWRRGPVRDEELRGLVYVRREDPASLRQHMGQRLAALEGTWLQKTLVEAPIRPEYPFAVGEDGPRWYLRPGLWIGVYLVVASILLFVVLW
jgi:SSS family solute:Na+ symporter